MDRSEINLVGSMLLAVWLNVVFAAVHWHEETGIAAPHIQRQFGNVLPPPNRVKNIVLIAKAFPKK